MNIVKASDGRANLHIWREGAEYFRQKGPIFLKEWTNIMFCVLPYPPGGPVHHYDIRQPLPFPDNSFDDVDIYHVLEHLSPSEGKGFIAEIFRVIKAGGICRVSVPDLERIVREYLEFLEASLAHPTPENILKYEWAVMELIDQAVREKSGGMMVETLRRTDIDKDYIKRRYSDVFAGFFQPRRSVPTAHPAKGAVGASQRRLLKKLFSRSPLRTLKEFYWEAQPRFYALLREYKHVLAKGDPRSAGETVKWMYDRFSLTRLLEGAGFIRVSQKDFAVSDILNWEKYNLDKSNYGGYAIDPSVYVEGKKPV